MKYIFLTQVDQKTKKSMTDTVMISKKTMVMLVVEGYRRTNGKKMVA